MAVESDFAVHADKPSRFNPLAAVDPASPAEMAALADAVALDLATIKHAACGSRDR